MIVPLDSIARARRRWFETRPELRRHLRRPVISVGNLGFGGSGKTPMVQHLVSTLLELGERPAVLSRGYGRLIQEDGVVVVRDAGGIRADLGRSGDEPLMLARELRGAAVLVSPDRYLGGRLAEEHLGCTVHVLDDGFQHLSLARDIDCVMLTNEDLERPRWGMRREPIDALDAADAVFLAPELGDPTNGRRVPPMPRSRVFQTMKRQGRPCLLESHGTSGVPGPGARVVAAAAIARPDRFFDDVEGAGYVIARSVRFPDHHQFSLRDLREWSDTLRDSQADMVMTTEKDMVRLLPLRPIDVPIAWLPVTYSATPQNEFRAWLAERLQIARENRAES